MRILVSNDDGIFAPGIKILAEKLATEHEVYVIAPDRERSANGHALTLNKPLRAEEVNIFDGVKFACHVNGTPADCVKLAIGAILEEMPDMVISGINRGQNMGTDIMYSGTVSAAMEGTILGIPSIALSLASFSDVHYETGAEFALKLANELATKELPSKTLLNVNIPAIPADQVKGVKITKLGVHKYTDIFEKRTDLRGKHYYWFAGESLEYQDEEDTDIVAVKKGYISVTPIHYDLTNYEFLNDLKNWDVNIKDKIEVKK
ncbi:MAG: 5'/3'-nucleotidase SurE [Candidatus Sericytochromatia bacterium]|nr:5'/3'-nucleotidase SurE [Candidatus Sericytochromatia bacterium]